MRAAVDFRPGASLAGWFLADEAALVVGSSTLTELFGRSDTPTGSKITPGMIGRL